MSVTQPKARRLLRVATWGLLALLASFATAIATQSVTDDVGQSLAVDPPPERVIALAPELAELVVTMGCGDKLIARTQFTNYPESITKLPVIGTYIQPNLEQIIALTPDLVLATGRGNPKDIVERLRGLGIASYTYFPKSIPQLPDAIGRLGAATGCAAGANDVAQALTKRLDALKAPAATVRPKVLILVNGDPLFAIGPHTMAHDLIQWTGGRNIIGGDTRYPRIGLELVLEKQPDIIVLAHQGGPCPMCAPDWWSDKPVPAATHGLIVTLDPDLISRAGPRLAEAAGLLKGWIDRARTHLESPPK